ncbi:MAG: hypothetical protein NTY48_00690 [Candidatus Diapherotrites archaeon]|nr:hypothetical protein [Candidatus Diapherotrites archaeon]
MKARNQSLNKFKKRRALFGRLSAKERARIRSRQAQQLFNQAVKQRERNTFNPEKRAAQHRVTFGETNVDAAKRLLTDQKNLDRMSIREINHKIATAGVMRILNADRMQIDFREAKELLGNAGKIMELFVKRLPSETELLKYIPGPKPTSKGIAYPPMKRFTIRGKEVRVYLEGFSLSRKWRGQKPDRVVQVLNEKLRNVPFLPPKTGELVNKDLGVISRMPQAYYPPKNETYKVMGWILFEDASSGRGSSHHLQVYLKKAFPNK